jgi:hypothetical protein
MVILFIFSLIISFAKINIDDPCSGHCRGRCRPKFQNPSHQFVVYTIKIVHANNQLIWLRIKASFQERRLKTPKNRTMASRSKFRALSRALQAKIPKSIRPVCSLYIQDTSCKKSIHSVEI